MGPKVLGVDLHSCTTLGIQSCHDLLKMQLLATVQCTVYADIYVVLWNSTFLHFIQHVLFFPCLLKCVYVYAYISVSLSFISPTLWKALGVYFSLCCFLLIFHLTHLSFSSLYTSLTYSLSPGFFFQLSLLFQLVERLEELLICCFISDKQCDHSQFTNLLHFKFLPCKRGEISPFYLFP